jgi:predicted transglutaminase-like cysteine proteinase
MHSIYIASFILFISLSARAEVDEPFGFPTISVPHNEYVADWRKVQDDWIGERVMLDRCRNNRELCPSTTASKFLTFIDEASRQVGRARLGYVNRAINLAIRPMSDLANYGVPEIWKTPLATLANGAGDCIDYAIAKYFALGEIGIPENNRRLLVVRIKSLGTEHALLIVRENQRWLILDNLRMAIVDAADAKQYIPLIELDYRGVRQFVQPAEISESFLRLTPMDIKQKRY